MPAKRKIPTSSEGHEPMEIKERETEKIQQIVFDQVEAKGRDVRNRKEQSEEKASEKGREVKAPEKRREEETVAQEEGTFPLELRFHHDAWEAVFTRLDRHSLVVLTLVSKRVRDAVFSSISFR